MSSMRLVSAGSRAVNVASNTPRLASRSFPRRTASTSASPSSVTGGAPSPPPPPSRPYARTRPALPVVRSFYRPAILLSLALTLGTWSAFTLHATNKERLSSSVVKNIVDHIRQDRDIERLMGDNVQLERSTYLLGDPWIRGNINMMQGRVDIKFRLKGQKGVYILLPKRLLEELNCECLPLPQTRARPTSPQSEGLRQSPLRRCDFWSCSTRPKILSLFLNLFSTASKATSQ